MLDARDLFNETDKIEIPFWLLIKNIKIKSIYFTLFNTCNIKQNNNFKLY